MQLIKGLFINSMIPQSTWKTNNIWSSCTWKVMTASTKYFQRAWYCWPMLFQDHQQGWILKYLSRNARKVITRKRIRDDGRKTVTKLHHWETHECGQSCELFKEIEGNIEANIEDNFFLLWCTKPRLGGRNRGWAQRIDREETELQLEIRSRSQIIRGTKTGLSAHRVRENVTASKMQGVCYKTAEEN